MFVFEGGTLLLRETVTMLRSRDVIHRGPTSFWCTTHISLTVIIAVLKKKRLFFDLPLYVGCLNIHGIHVTAYNSTNDNGVFFFFFFFFGFQIRKLCIITTINPRLHCLGQERKIYFASLLFWRQSHSKLSPIRCNPLIWWCFITETRNSKKDWMSWKLIW